MTSPESGAIPFECLIENAEARSYALTTPAGKKQLAAEKREWNRMVTTEQAILNEPS